MGQLHNAPESLLLPLVARLPGLASVPVAERSVFHPTRIPSTSWLVNLRATCLVRVNEGTDAHWGRVRFTAPPRQRKGCALVASAGALAEFIFCGASRDQVAADCYDDITSLRGFEREVNRWRGGTLVITGRLRGAVEAIGGAPRARIDDRRRVRADSAPPLQLQGLK